MTRTGPRITELSKQRKSDATLVRDVLSVATARRAAALVPTHSNAAADLWRSSRSWLRFPDVVGLEVAPRSRRGRILSEWTLRVMVQRKVLPSNPACEIPLRLPVPGTRRVICTDVEAVGEGGLDRDLRFSARRRPCEAGVAIRPYRGRPATFACLLRDQSNTLYVLSNAHVIAGFGHAAAGMRVYQPAPSRRHADALIARLALSLPVSTGPAGFENVADAAVARVDHPERVSPEMYGLGKIAGVSSKLPKIGQTIQKFGPATGKTYSRVAQVDSTVAVRWCSEEGRSARAGFNGVVRCSPKFTSGGDSGSAVLSERSVLLGLHFSSHMNSSYFIPIQTILDSFFDNFSLRLQVVVDHSSSSGQA